MLDELNTIQLKKILNKDNCIKNYYNNVYSIDTLPRFIKKVPAFLIINTSPSYVENGHWLAIYIHKNRYLEFFDSYGLSPKYYNLNKFIRNNSNYFSYNNIQLQSFITKTCGYFCLIFLLLKCHKININNFFKGNINQNEKKINYIFK